MTPLSMPTPGSTLVLQDRRRRARLRSQTQGWVLPANRIRLRSMPAGDDEGIEVRIENLSRLGVGFISAEPMALGIEQQLRVGRGPMTRSKQVRIVVCRKLDEHSFMIGVEFVPAGLGKLAKAG